MNTITQTKTSNVEQGTSNIDRRELLFTEDELAKASGVAAYDLRQYQPSWFGAPGHWRVCRTGGMVYTARGVEALASELDRLGVLAAASVGLRYLLRSRQEVPSRQLPLTAEALREVPHRPQAHAHRPWFQQGSME